MIAAAAHELATRHLAAGDLSGARAAGKNITANKEIAERLTRRDCRLGVEAEPETSELLDRHLGA